MSPSDQHKGLVERLEREIADRRITDLQTIRDIRALSALSHRETPKGEREAIARVVRERSRGGCELVAYHKVYAVTETCALEIADAILAALSPATTPGGDISVSVAESGGTASPKSESQHSAGLWRCKRCGRDEIDCRANGCERGPCPMEPV